MAKKTSVKVRLVPENKTNSSFFYYVKKPSSGDKAKIMASFSKFQSILTQVAKSGVINKKTASRKISKISKKISMKT